MEKFKINRNSAEFDEMREYLGIELSAMEDYPNLKKSIKTALTFKKDHAEEFSENKVGMGLHCDYYGYREVLEGEDKELSVIEEKDGIVLYRISSK